MVKINIENNKIIFLSVIILKTVSCSILLNFDKTIKINAEIIPQAIAHKGIIIL